MVQHSTHPRSASTSRWRRLAASAADDSVAGKPVAPELVAGVVPPSVLHQDEIVLLLVKPSLWFILLTSIRFMIIVALLGVLLVQHTYSLLGISSQQIALLVTLAAMGRLIWALLVWTSHIYLLTNKRIVTVKGVINVGIYQASLRKIQRTTLYRPILERLLGLGTLGFATAATGSAAESDSTWVMIPRPLATHQAVVDAIQRTS